MRLRTRLFPLLGLVTLGGISVFFYWFAVISRRAERWQVTRILQRQRDPRDLVVKVAFLAHDRTLISYSLERRVRIWDTVNGALVNELDGYLGAVISNPEVSRFLFLNKGNSTGCIYDTSSPLQFVSVDLGRGSGTTAFSPDGHVLAVNREDGTLKLCSPSSGSFLASLHTGVGAFWGLSFSPDGRLLAGAGPDRKARLWTIPSLTPLGTLEGHTDSVIALHFSPTGFIATASLDKTARLWDVRTKRETASLPHGDAVVGARFSPKGEYVGTVSCDGYVRLWDTDSARELYRHKIVGRGSDAVWDWSVSFAPDGASLLTTGEFLEHGVLLIGVPDGKVLSRFEDQGCRVVRACFSADGTQIAMGCRDGSIYLWSRIKRH